MESIESVGPVEPAESVESVESAASEVRPLRADAERNRQRILEAARELFSTRGLGVTLNDIAHHAGVGVGTVYRRFPDKAELIDDLFEQRLEDLVALMEQALADPDPWHGLVGFLRGALSLQADDRGLRELAFGTPEGLERLGRIRARLYPLGSELVERAVAAGQLRPDFEPQDVPVIQMMLATVMDAARELSPELWRRYLDIVLRGIRADAGAPEPLPVSPLSPDQIERAMAEWRHGIRR
jgi:AcrR family transcriptional regulator